MFYIIGSIFGPVLLKYDYLHDFWTFKPREKNPLIVVKIFMNWSKWSQTDIKICQELQLLKIFKMITRFFLKQSRSSKSCKTWFSCQTVIPDLNNQSTLQARGDSRVKWQWSHNVSQSPKTLKYTIFGMWYPQNIPANLEISTTSQSVD